MSTILLGANIITSLRIIEYGRVALPYQYCIISSMTGLSPQAFVSRVHDEELP